MISQNLVISNKTKKTLKVVATSVLSAAIVLPTASNAISDIQYRDYSTDRQIETIANHLNLNTEDTFRFENKCARFIHNNGKPIQVLVKPELKEYLPQIKTALDNMVGLLHSVNSNYKYEFVEKIDNSKSRIIFKTATLEKENNVGLVSDFSQPYTASKLDNKMLISEGSVVIDLEKYKEQDSYMQYYIMNHELAHLFGLKTDVYNFGIDKRTDSHLGNTFIKVEIGSKVNMMTPYDITSVLALYTPQAETKEDLYKKLSFCDDYLVEYSKKYYNYYTQRTKELINQASSNSANLTSFNPDEDFKFNYSVSASDNEKSYECNYELTYDDGGYNFKIYNEKGKLLDECSGDVVLDNDIMVIKNLNLKNGLRPNNVFDTSPEGYVQDLALFKNNDEICLFDIFDCSINYGTTNY